MLRAVILGLAALAAVSPFGAPALAAAQPVGDAPGAIAPRVDDVVAMAAGERELLPAERVVLESAARRYAADLDAMRQHRSGYAFWHHVFTIPDGSILYGEAETGRLLARLPVRGDWTRAGEWEDDRLAAAISRVRLPSNLTQRRSTLAEILTAEHGPVVHNASRGDFVLPNAKLYGSFLEEWGRIYERFGVPADIGLAQALVESGFNGRVRSEARALGFCQWLPQNWERLKRASPVVIEGYNQTTQAQYCAAYLSVLATKYGSFIPALSEHHAGGANVGRVVITGARLGAEDIRDRYLQGAAFLRDLRDLAPRTFSDLYRTYGPRSYLYSEMVFGNTITVQRFRETIEQERIYAMRTTRAIPIGEITRKTGLSADEVRRFNPALVREVPRNATLYLPFHVEEFGEDVAFWHHAPSPAFAEVLAEFLNLGAAPEDWYEPGFEDVLRGYQRRFQETGTEEGHVMATVLAYTIWELGTTRPLIAEYRSSRAIQQLFERGVQQRARALASRTMAE